MHVIKVRVVKPTMGKSVVKVRVLQTLMGGGNRDYTYLIISLHYKGLPFNVDNLFSIL